MTVLCCATIGCSLVVLVLVPLRLMGGGGAHRMAVIWARSICSAAGIRIETEGLENLPSEPGFIIASNHQGVFDIVVSFIALPVEYRWLAKRSLFKIPIMGRAMRLAGHLPVDREDSASIPGLLKGAARAIRSGTNVIIFPEGTRNKTPEKGLLEFKMGGFILARLARRPMIPLALSGTGRTIQTRPFRVCPGTVLVRLGRPIRPEDYSAKEMESFSARVRQEMSGLLEGRKAES